MIKGNLKDKFKFMALRKVCITLENLESGKGYGNDLRKPEAVIPKSFYCHFRALFSIQKPREQEKLMKK